MPFFNRHRTQNIDWVDKAISKLDKAFKKNMVAIIGNDRINNIGKLGEKNRYKNLNRLKQVLEMIISQYSFVKFLDSAKINNVFAGD